ncbi:MAG: response regulator [Proteobacteria bacterium]|nr:response regulator [Pseudomonadota bacterium]
MKRIIFVDDEPLNLAAARRIINAQKKWKAVYTSDAERALVALENEPFDCIVSDLNMPENDGSQLLENVKNQFPEIVRIIFTASHPDECLSLSAVAHQIWSKSSDLNDLLGSLEQTLRIQSLLSNSEFSKKTGQVGFLPSVPRLARELTAVLSNSNFSSKHVAAVIEKDPAMSAKILQLVNSAFFRMSRRITSIPEAVIRLGMDTLCHLAKSDSICRSFDESNKIPGFDIAHLQSKSLLTAIIAAQLFSDRRRCDDAFVSALLKSIGQLILASRMPEYFADVLLESTEQNQPLHMVEMAKTGVDHAALGACLLSLWGLPTQIVEAVANQFTPRPATDREFDVSDAVFVASHLIEQGTEPDEDAVGQSLNEDWLYELGITKEDISFWRDAVSNNPASVLLKVS